MPIVARHKVRLHKRDFVRKIGYSPKHKDFYMPLPDYVGDLLGYEEVRAETQYAVERRWSEAIKEYDERASRIHKVIFYRFLSRIQPYGMPLGNYGSGMSAYESRGEMISYGVAMDLWFLIGYVVRIPSGEEDYLDENKKKIGRSASPRNYMDWTEAREAFFREFREVIVHQINRMHEFFYEDESKIPELIDLGMTGRKFLPGPEEE